MNSSISSSAAAEASDVLTPPQHNAQNDFLLSEAQSSVKDNNRPLKQIVCEEVESPSINLQDGVPPLTWSPGAGGASVNVVHSHATPHDNDNTRLRVLGQIADTYQRGLNSGGSTSPIQVGSPGQIQSVHHQLIGLVSSDEQMRVVPLASKTQGFVDYTNATFGPQSYSGGENTLSRYQLMQNQVSHQYHSRMGTQRDQSQNSGPLGSIRNPPLVRLCLHDDQQGVTDEQGESQDDVLSNLSNQFVGGTCQLPRFHESSDQIVSALGPFNTSANDIDYLHVNRSENIQAEKVALMEDPYWRKQTEIAQEGKANYRPDEKLIKLSPIFIALLFIGVDCALHSSTVYQQSYFSSAAKVFSMIALAIYVYIDYSERPKLILIQDIGKDSPRKSTRDIRIEVETQTSNQVSPSIYASAESPSHRFSPLFVNEQKALSPFGKAQLCDAQTSCQEFPPDLKEVTAEQSSQESVSLSREESLRDKSMALEESNAETIINLVGQRRKSQIRHKTFLDKDIGNFDDTEPSANGTSSKVMVPKMAPAVKKMSTMKRFSFDQMKFELIRERNRQITMHADKGDKSPNQQSKNGVTSSFMSSDTEDLLNPQPNAALKEARKTFMSKAHNSQNDTQAIDKNSPLSKFQGMNEDSMRPAGPQDPKYWPAATNEDLAPGMTEQQLFNVDTLGNKNVDYLMKVPEKYQNVYTGQGFGQKYSHFIPPLFLDRGRSVYEIAQINQVGLQKIQQDYERRIKHLERKLERCQRDSKNAQESLQKKLKNTKIFLNMVIHDMRNPTTSIEFAIKEVLKMIMNAREKSEKNKETLARVTTVQMMPSKNPFSVLRLGTSELKNNDSDSEDPESPDLEKHFLLPLHKESAKFPENSQDQKIKNIVSIGLKKSTPGQSFRGAISEGYLDNCEFQSSRIMGMEHMTDQPVIFASRGKNMASKISEHDSDESIEALADDHSSCSDDISEGEKNVMVSIVHESHESFAKQQLCSPLLNDQKGRRRLLLTTDAKEQMHLALYQNDMPDFNGQRASSKVSFAPGKNSENMKKSNTRKVEVRIQSSNERESRQEFELVQDSEYQNYFKNLSSSEKKQPTEEQKQAHDFYQTFGKSLSKQKIKQKKQKEFTGLRPMAEDQESNSFAMNNKLGDQLNFASAMIMNHLKNDHSSKHYLEMEGMLKNANFSATMLLNLINDLLDLAKMENQSFNLNASYFNLIDDVISQAVITLEHLTQQKNIQVKLVNTGGESNQIEHYLRCVHSDKSRFLQIMLNFLSNAIKFTPEHGSIIIETIVKETQDIRVQERSNESRCGGVQGAQEERNMIKMMNEFNMKSKKKCLTPRGPKTSNLNDFKQTDEEGQRKYINFEIRIKDSGCGISQENLGKLFLNFGRLEEHQKSNERGTGLGLSICKSLLEKMGGNVSVESEGPGMGTTFIIKMQAKCKVQRKVLAKNAELEMRGRRLKIKESVIRRGLNRSYSHFKEPLATIEIGQLHSDAGFGFDTGFQKIIQKQATLKVQLLADLKFSIQGQNEQRMNDPAVSNRAVNQPKLIEDVLKVQGYLKPPNDFEDLCMKPKARLNSKGPGLMRKMTFLPKNNVDNDIELADFNSPKGFHILPSRQTNKSGRAASAQNLEDVPKAKYKILVANDDSFQLMILMRVLKQFSDYFEIIDQAENGMAASNLVMNSKKEVPGQVKRPYDLIILDLDMPILNGYDACRQIRESDHVSNNGLHNLLRMDFKTPEFEMRNRSISVMEGDNSYIKFKDQPMVVALSAYLNQDIIVRCETAGFDDYLESPLTKDKIMQKLILPLEKRKALKEAANQGNESSENDEKEDSEAMQNQFEGLQEVLMGTESHYLQSLPKGGFGIPNSEHTELYAGGACEGSNSNCMEIISQKKIDQHTFGGFQVKRRLDERRKSNRMGRPQTINEEYEEGKTPC